MVGAVSDDSDVDHAKLQTRYLVHYDSPAGPRFSITVHNAPWQAQDDVRRYAADGYKAKVLRVRVVDGQPVAEWMLWPDPATATTSPQPEPCGRAAGLGYSKSRSTG
jgi:hypothetical protein